MRSNEAKALNVTFGRFGWFIILLRNVNKRAARAEIAIMLGKKESQLFYQGFPMRPKGRLWIGLTLEYEIQPD